MQVYGAWKVMMLLLLFVCEVLSSSSPTTNFSKTTCGTNSSAVQTSESSTSLDSLQKRTNYAVAFMDYLSNEHVISESKSRVVCLSRTCNFPPPRSPSTTTFLPRLFYNYARRRLFIQHVSRSRFARRCHSLGWKGVPLLFLLHGPPPRARDPQLRWRVPE